MRTQTPVIATDGLRGQVIGHRTNTSYISMESGKFEPRVQDMMKHFASPWCAMVQCSVGRLASEHSVYYVITSCVSGECYHKDLGCT